MNLPQILVLAVLFIPLGFVLWGKLRVDIAAWSGAAALGILQFAGVGVLGPPATPGDAIKAIAGFSQPAVLTLIGLFMLTYSLDQSGVMNWAARHMLRLGGRSETRLVLLFSAATALCSLVMNNVAAGALLLPSALETARRAGIRPSKLLIPVSFGSLLGGMATYFTTANIITSDLLRLSNPPQPALSMLDFLPTGGLIALAGILYLALLGRRLLPERAPGSADQVPGLTGRQLEEYFLLGERLWQLQLQAESPLAGKSLAEAGLGRDFGVAVPLLWHGRQAILAPNAEERLQAGDEVLVVGREERVAPLMALGLLQQPASNEEDGLLSARGLHLAELVVAPHSNVLGRTLKEIDFRRQHGVTVVALRRGERSYRTDVGDIALSLGDTLLAVGGSQQLRALRRHPLFFLLEPAVAEPAGLSRRAVPAVLITGAAIIASILGVPTYLAVFSGAVLALLARVIRTQEAYQAVEWPAIFQIAGMVAISQAMVQTGLSGLVGQQLVALAAPLGPLGLAGGAFLLAALLTQVIGGQVTALVAGPVVISAALQIGAPAQAVALAMAIGCSASFLTPMAHPVNILMMTPGSYRFGDFFRVGWLLMLLVFGMLLLGLKLFWGL